ncbi:MAG: biotin/lipoyl-binding protein [Bacteroidetes bacterium]|nr:MAG: biotin/lipoyl-binding protein [Bacteroidota bacterium]
MNKLLLHIENKVFTIEQNGEQAAHSFRYGTNADFFIDKNNKTHRYLINRLSDTEYEVWIKHCRIVVTVQDEQSELISVMQSHQPKEITIKSPMPGLIVAVEVAPGDEVTAGAGLLILEAMKMENEIKSPAKATVKKIEVGKGDKVEKGEVLMVLEAK